MRLLLVIILLLFVINFSAYAQSGGGVVFGAKSAGMANAVVTVSDAWSVFNNIGTLAHIKESSAVFGYTNRFGFQGWNTIGAGFVTPLSFGGAIGFGMTRFGDALYNQNRIALGYSHQLYGVNLGIQVNYVTISIANFGTKHALALEFGGMAQLSETLFVGAHIYNLNQAKLQAFEDERFPTVMRAGISYRPIKKLMVNLETQKDMDYSPSFLGGVSYELLAEKVWVRTGISTQPFVSYYGAGFRYKGVEFDYALNTHSQLGFSHHLSLLYKIKALKTN